MTPQEFIDKLYINLLDQKWKMNEIDEMDIMYYLKLQTIKMKKEKVYIDNIL